MSEKLKDKTFEELQQYYGTGKYQKLHVVELAELLAMDLPPRELILSPWLPKAGLCMLHAYRGIGKTHLSLGIAYVIARGGTFLNWHVEKPAGVLFVDGEMPAQTLQERLARIVSMYGDHSIPGKLQIITPDLQCRGMPDIATPDGQAAIEANITDEIDLIILDNLSCLANVKENDAYEWVSIQTWVLSLRAKGKSVLLIHHSGKNGNQRGTSKREDVLDTVISLKRPDGYTSDQGACFVVNYDKSRGFCGEDAKSFEAQLTVDSHSKPCWVTKSIEQSTYEKVVVLTNEGMSQKEISEELGINKSTVSRHLNKANSEGLIHIRKGGKRYE